MAKVLGLDIGGVNIKGAYVENGNLEIATEYFPIWKRNKNNLPKILDKLTFRLTQGEDIDAVGVTMTAELSDAYFDKCEGINHILDCVEKTFRNVPIHVLNVGGEFISSVEARRRILEVASANWAATGWLISKHVDSSIVIDVGSTTATIIPIINSKVAAEGKTDLDKLSNGELVYTGALRTNVAAIVQTIPLRNRIVKISSELFSTSGDVHRILGNITEKEYTVETADGRGKSEKECKARLARVVCADLNMLKNKEIMIIAKYIAEKQVEQIAEGLKQILKRKRIKKKGGIFAVTTGIGKNFLAGKAASKVGLKHIPLDKIVKGASYATPASALAIMVKERYD